MKTLCIAAAAAAMALGACSPPAEAPQTPEAPIAINVPTGVYALDPHHSTVSVRARHFGLAYYVLRFNGVSGALDFNAEDPALSSIEATVNTATLDTPYLGERDFDAELQNSEWLDAAGFPVALFRSTSVERTGPNTGRVTGELTVRGQTHPATFDVTYYGSHAQHPMGFPMAMIGFQAKTTISRAQYGLSVLQPLAAGGNDGVSDRVDLVIEAEFTRPVESGAAAPAEPVD